MVIFLYDTNLPFLKRCVCMRHMHLFSLVGNLLIQNRTKKPLRGKRRKKACFFFSQLKLCENDDLTSVGMKLSMRMACLPLELPDGGVHVVSAFTGKKKLGLLREAKETCGDLHKLWQHKKKPSQTTLLQTNLSRKKINNTLAMPCILSLDPSRPFPFFVIYIPLYLLKYFVYW